MHFRKSLHILTFVACLVPIASIEITCAAEHAVEPAVVAGRDWKQHPAIVDLPAADDVYALGDVHGDCDRMLELLAAAKLIAGVPAGHDAVKWTGGKADLVLTGDMIDKYEQSLRVLAVLRVLEPQAQAAGGHLIICLGNHEAEFLASGGQGKKGAEFENELTAAGLSPREVAAGRDPAGIGAWLRNLPAGAKVGDWFFCHAGNTGGKKLAVLESELEKGLAGQGYATPLLSDPNSMLEARMHPRPWFEAVSDPSLHEVKGLKASSSKPPAKLVETVEALGARHLVIGHQPGRTEFSDGTTREEGQMFSHYEGLFFMIDTGMSRGVSSSHGKVLHIHASSRDGECATAIDDRGGSTLLWKR